MIPFEAKTFLEKKHKFLGANHFSSACTLRYINKCISRIKNASSMHWVWRVNCQRRRKGQNAFKHAKTTTFWWETAPKHDQKQKKMKSHSPCLILFAFSCVLKLGRTEFLYFPFDEMKDGTVIGPQLNGTAVNSPVLVPGIRGQALSLDGINQYVDFGSFRWAKTTFCVNNTILEFMLHVFILVTFVLQKQLFGILEHLFRIHTGSVDEAWSCHAGWGHKNSRWNKLSKNTSPVWHFFVSGDQVEIFCTSRVHCKQWRPAPWQFGGTGHQGDPVWIESDFEKQDQGMESTQFCLLWRCLVSHCADMGLWHYYCLY